MPAFNRIRRDVDKFGGQPYIDQTDITVKQILVLSMRGVSFDGILAQYPQLSPDDIHQALSFAISDMFKGISYWRHDGMTPLTQIKGYSEILVGKTEFDDLDTIPDAQKQQWLSIIHSSSQRGIARWQQMSQWLSKQYLLDTDEDLEVYQLEHFIVDLITTAQNYEPSLEIEVSQFDSRLDIQTHGDTTLILGSILAFAKNTFKPETTVIVDANETHVFIEVHRQLLYPDDDVQKLLTTPYNAIATALTFFHMQNMGFHMSQAQDTLIFAVELPIWHD